MKFFIDTADVTEIKDLAPTGLIDGVTTNPSLIAQSGGNLKENITEICSIIDGPISAEVLSTDFDSMVVEGRKLREISDQVVVKVPLTIDGLKCCKVLSDEEIMVNVTLCFSPAQALLAAKAGAAYISPFVGRIDDTGRNGMELIEEIVEIYDNYDFTTEVLVASVRSPLHVIEAARLGAEVATLPPKIIRQIFQHPLTNTGLEAFLKDASKSGQTI